MAFDEYQEQRELLNQVRPCGKGAKGGVGSRQRRNPNKVFTRKLSQQEQQRTDDRVQAIIKECSASLSENQLGSIDNLLRDTYHLDLDKLHGAPALLNAVSLSPHRRLVIKASAEYLRAIVFAYALYEKIVSSGPGTMRIYIHKLSELTKISITPEFSLLRAVVRLAIDYDEDNPESDHHGKWSRDALAIQWLINQGVRSNQVVAYQKKNGGGVNKWSRLGADPAASAKKKREIEVAAARMERDIAEKKVDPNDWLKELEEDEKSENARGEGTNWDDMDPGTYRSSRERNRLEKLGGGGPWHTEMKLYYKRELGIAPEEAMVTLVVGDRSPLGVREVGTMSIGHVTADESRLAKGFRLLGSRLSVVLAHGERFTWNEAAWRHDRDNARAGAERRRATWLPRGRPYKPRR